MRTSRTWYVEDIHGQTGLYIKAYKNKPEGVATVKVVEELEAESQLPAFDHTACVYFDPKTNKIFEGIYYFTNTGGSLRYIMFSNEDGSFRDVTDNLDWFNMEYLGKLTEQLSSEGVQNGTKNKTNKRK